MFIGRQPNIKGAPLGARCEFSYQEHAAPTERNISFSKSYKHTAPPEQRREP